jgi:hypothetical protein
MRVRQRFGRAQVFAGLLLLLFLAQGLWLAVHRPFDPAELAFLGSGAKTETPPSAGSPASPTLASWGGSAPVLIRLLARAPGLGPFRSAPSWRVRLPFLLIGCALGASLWYVARRLCGNAGGGVALALYAFSPTMLTCSARVGPEIVAAWSVFGCVFTSIAVAHTLYAPREVVLWNWRRILLLGTAIGLSAGSHFITVTAAGLGLAFMLYLVPERRGAALGIMAAAVAVGSVWFGALEGFHLPAIGRARAFMPQVLGAPDSSGHRLVLQLLRDGPGFLLLLLIAFGALCVWRRPRFFGTLAPLLAAALLIVCGVIFPVPGFSFMAVALPFLFVFTAGVWADLLQSRLAPLALATVLAALAVHAYWPHG